MHQKIAALLLIVVALLASADRARAADCDVLKALEIREAEHEMIAEKIQGGKSAIGKKIDEAILTPDRRKWQHILEEASEKGYSEASVMAKLGELEERSRKANEALEIFGPLDKRLGALKLGPFARAPGVSAEIAAEARRLDSLYESWAAKGKYSVADMNRIEERLKALEKLAALEKKIVYVNPGHHDAAKAGMGKRSVAAGTSTLPSNHEELWKQAIPSPDNPDKNWWVFDGEDWHRFDGHLNQATGELEFHWNGSTRASDDPKLVIPFDKVPKTVKEYFGQT